MTCPHCKQPQPPEGLVVHTPFVGPPEVRCITCDPPPTPKRGAKPKRKLSDGEDSQSTLGPSKTVNFRIPVRLYKQVQRLAHSRYQPDPVIFRDALHEYVARHKPQRGVTSGLSLVWHDDDSVSAEVTQPETPLTPSVAPRSEE